MKKGIKVLGLLLICLLMVGCMNIKVEMGVNNDRSVDVNLGMDIDMLKFIKNLVSDEDTWKMMQQQMIEENCANSCDFDEESNEYESCMNTCRESASNTVTQPTDEKLKEYLDAYIESDEFTVGDIMNEEDIQELRDKGYEVESNFDKENFTYKLQISQHFNNIDDIASENESKVNMNEVLEGDTNNIFFIKVDDDTYKAKLNFDEEDNSLTSVENELPIDMDMQDLITYTFEVTLPTKAKSNNASKKENDDKTLIWNLANKDTKEINFEFTFPKKGLDIKNIINLDDDKLNIVAYALIGGGLLTLILTLVIMLKKKKA